MNPLRYQELLGRLLEGELVGAEADEFSAGLSADPALQRDLRQHLVLWEVWSQHQATERTLRGEAVCTACVLHESDKHAPAIRVLTDAATNIYYLDRNSELTALQDYFCSGPNVATAEGEKRTEKGRLLFHATIVTIPAANQPRETPTNSVGKIFPI